MDQWRVEQPFAHQTSKGMLVIPSGFVFDLASIPRVIWNVIAPFELSLAAPLVHDFLYRFGGLLPNGERYTRGEVDDMFLEIMTSEGVSPWRRIAAYRAVRMFGGRAWDSGINLSADHL
jgi:hypothetical protein